MMSLRQWQEECVKLTLERYNEGQPHFLCLATPGAGKSVMAAEVAFRLFKVKKIDFVLCFSPSTSISQGLEQTFTSRLNCRFDGIIGALGASYTYQNLQFFDRQFWELIKNNRVLVIFDEIHHCAGSSLNDANSWGEKIIENIQSQATYTLALTGTPWRSDKAPICLSNYTDPNNQIECNYVYGLSQAVSDGVCRSPKIVLIDNAKITIRSAESESKNFSCINDFLKDSSGSYQAIINDEKCMEYLLQCGINKLEKIRKNKKNAAGLVIASSVEHALKLFSILSRKYKKNTVLVTYKHDDPAGKINHFRHSEAEWIVSVGMVSEGTDIPRLQVCCHLSRVKTELHFRQVLGRILRVNRGDNQEAWLYTFAEPNLVKYAHRVDKEIPEQNLLFCDDMSGVFFSSLEKKENGSKDMMSNLRTDLGEFNSLNENSDEFQIMEPLSYLAESHEHYFDIVGSFRQQIVDVFQ
ncbi:DEAD/DEAH box helicase [Aliivibrio fischeri]|jgi:superfamily II DNA or RNA helicase|uniref:DEAD/DEAH box helicase n=1 Tax=Aliivibrio fischeri TaxID=668 RepID=UPI00166581A9|nr:DEAD/DEAH box helicase family protein [Aliivibrio fischeri]USR95410.1 DEAD/DEAH box helicase family protein [Aliivibrio fischeri ATCC 7744 = JCM 18803 = DSM 507]USR97690.1 DEAD/DEAH box helicase family protein [Aliivibrio fischeri ATCC 7744 = JCM 18803 = DSM 507]GGK49329.1 diguanylate cyclase [Aliivibrio fischeri]